MVKRRQILTKNSTKPGKKPRPIDSIFLEPRLGGDGGSDGYTPLFTPVYTPRGLGQGRNSSHFGGDLDGASTPLSARDPRGFKSDDRPVGTAPAAPSSLESRSISLRPGESHACVHTLKHVRTHRPKP